MKPGARLVPLLLGLVLSPGGLLGAEATETPKPAPTRMNRQLGQLIREDAGVLPPAPPAADEPAVVAEGILELETMIIEEEKLKELPPPETKAAKFLRTGTLWEKVGPKFTRRFWMKGDRGILFTLSW
jgi:hypothetical protein